MTSELKPCPFCGGKASFHIYGRACNVVCDDCQIGTRLEHIDEYEVAIDAWNRRVKPGDGKSLTDEEMEILNDMPALKKLAMIAGFEVER